MTSTKGMLMAQHFLALGTVQGETEFVVVLSCLVATILLAINELERDTNIRRRRGKKRAKRISGLQRGDAVTMPGGKHGVLLERCSSWEYWSVEVEGELSPQAYTDKELKRRKGRS